MVLVNGGPSFHATTGLRKGNPLSPLLFIIIMEASNKLLKTACDLNLFEGVKIGKFPNQIEVSHLFFADDSLILYKPRVDYTLNLRCIILCFQVVFGLKINIRNMN